VSRRRLKIITISGAPNTGKSTVADQLVCLLPDTILIELDVFKHLYRMKHGPYVAEDAAALAGNWLARGKSVVFSGPFWKDSYVGFRRILRDRLGEANPEYYHFTLAPPIEVALADRGDRELDEIERARVRDFYGRDIHRPGFGVVIDNQHQAPVETARLIVEHIGTGAPTSIDD